MTTGKTNPGAYFRCDSGCGVFTRKDATAHNNETHHSLGECLASAPTGGDEERIAELRERVAGPHVGSIYEEESYFRDATEFLLDLLSRSALSSEDSQRIDWIEENQPALHTAYLKQNFGWLIVSEVPSSNVFKPSLREALDAARHLSSTPTKSKE